MDRLNDPNYSVSLDESLTTNIDKKMTKKGYQNGNDLLLSIGGKACGHCTDFTYDIKNETKERTVKPVASAAMTEGVWKDKSVTSKSVSISANGLAFYEETESGTKACLALAAKNDAVDIKIYERGTDTTPIISGKFIITSMQVSSPAGEDVTYSLSLENAGEVTISDAGVNAPVSA